MDCNHDIWKNRVWIHSHKQYLVSITSINKDVIISNLTYSISSMQLRVFHLSISFLLRMSMQHRGRILQNQRMIDYYRHQGDPMDPNQWRSTIYQWYHSFSISSHSHNRSILLFQEGKITNWISFPLSVLSNWICDWPHSSNWRHWLTSGEIQSSIQWYCEAFEDDNDPINILITITELFIWRCL